MSTDHFQGFKRSRQWHPGRPKDPSCADVGLVNIEFVHRSGTLKVTLNDLGQIGYNGTLRSLSPLDGINSVASAGPAILVRTDEAQFGLTPAEADRFARLALEPDEFFAVCDAVGCIWLTHDDFYDPTDGSAVQPKPSGRREQEPGAKA